ncbi:MAG: hypothetical protein ABI425_02395 [Patescibacteria group bacterium]
MNILIWILRIALGFWNIAGGLYMMSNYESLANNWALNTLPSFFWIILGILQIIFSIGLILPDKIKLLPNQTVISAIGLSIISFMGIGLYLAYSGVGMLWAVIPAGLAAYVAYKKLR